MMSLRNSLMSQAHVHELFLKVEYSGESLSIVELSGCQVLMLWVGGLVQTNNQLSFSRIADSTLKLNKHKYFTGICPGH